MFSRDGRYLYGSSYYTGVSNIFRYEVATGDDRGGIERRDRLLPPGAARRRPARRAELHRRGLRAGDHRAAAARGRERDHVPRRRGRREAPGGQDLAGAAAEHRRLREAIVTGAAPTCRCGTSALANAYPGAAGLQGLRRASATSVNFDGSAQLRDHRRHRGRTRPTTSCRRTSAATSTIDCAATSAGARRCRGTARTSTTCSARPSAAARATPRSVGYDHLLIYDEPRRLDAQVRARVLRQDRHAARLRRTSATTSTACSPREVGPLLHRRAPLARRRRRREGRRVERRSLTVQPRRRRDASRSCAAASTSAATLPLRATRRSGCAAPRASPTATRDDPVANFYFGGFGNNYVDSRTIKRYREYDAFPGFEHQRDRGPQLRARRWSSGTCRRSSSSRSARRRFHLHVAAPGGVRLGAVDRSRALGAPRSDYAERRRAGRPALQRAALVRHDAVGRLRGGLPRRRRAPATSGWCRSRSCDVARCSRRTRWWACCRCCCFLAALVLLDSYKLVRCASSSRVVRRRRGGGAWLPTLQRLRSLGRARRSSSRPTRATSRRSSRRSLKAAGGRGADPRAPHRLPGRRGDPRLRGRHRLRAGREPPVPAAGAATPASAPGSCAASARRSCTAASTAIFAMMGLAMLERASARRPLAFAAGARARGRAALGVQPLLRARRSSRRSRCSSCCRRCWPTCSSAASARVGDWLGTGFDADTEMLALDQLGTLRRLAGRALPRTRSRTVPGAGRRRPALLPAPAHRARAARQGRPDDARERLRRAASTTRRATSSPSCDYLEKSIGKTGLLALKPMLHMSHRDLWQLHMLGGK